MGLIQRVAGRYLQASINFSREEDGDLFFILAHDERGLEVGWVNVGIREFKVEELGTLGNCTEDIYTLVRSYSQLVAGGRVRVLFMSESFVEINHRGKGLGIRLYKEAIKEASIDEAPFLFIPHYCIKGKTSDQAKRVWASLARLYPSSGGCLAVLTSRPQHH